MRVTVFRKEHFNAAHRLNNPAWSEEKNRQIFGKCNNPFYHGHNYEMVVEVSGEVDPETGYVMDMKVLSDLISEFVLEVFDHRNLNEEVEYFHDLNPTAENIVLVIWKILREKIDTKLELAITLYETERNFVRYPANR
jgi:6-pyruvoyltetrahydropterin/6-carboxytetrahydropterin synthase